MFFIVIDDSRVLGYQEEPQWERSPVAWPVCEWLPD